MKPIYDFRYIEEKWRARWEREGTYRTDLHAGGKPYYNLMMFPYPSAEGLHVGNMFAFVGSDIHGRYKKSRGYSVFEPIGFDAFGIHSENHAMKTGSHPWKMVPENIRHFRDNQPHIAGKRHRLFHSRRPGHTDSRVQTFPPAFAAYLPARLLS